jgi:hypothetical protein
MPVAALGAIAAGGFAILEAGSVAAVSFSLLGLTGWEAVFARVAISFVISELGSALSPKPKSPDLSSLSNRAQQRTQQITQAVGPSEVVYCEVLKSGTVVYASNTEDNKYTHIVILLADHEVAGIDEIWVNSDVVPNDYLDSGGNVVTGKYAGYLRIKKHLGTDGQTADSDLVAEDPAWTSAHRLRGRAYIYIRYQRNQKVFPSAPNFAAIVRGKKIFDSRTAATAWTPNIALVAYDWLQDDKFGVGTYTGNIGTAETEAAANSCEEMVATQAIAMTVTAVDTGTNILTLTDAASNTLLQFQRGDAVQVTSTGTIPAGLAAATDYYVIPYQFAGTPRIKLAASLSDALANDGTGNAVDITSAGSGTITLTKTHEPRYFGGGVISSDRAGGDALKDILSGMAGRVTYTGGVYRLYAGVWRGPTDTVDEDDLRVPVSVQTRTTRASRFNTIIGTYISPLNNWQAADYPQVQNSTYVSNDMGDILQTQLDLPFTQRASTAQRIAAIKLNLSRQEMVVTYPGKLTCLTFMPMDTLYVDNTRMGWSGKIFEVQTWKLGFQNGGDAPQPGIDMVLQETDSTCYDWSSTNEVTVDPAPNTNLPDPFTVPEIVGLSISSIAIRTKGSDTLYRVVATWNAITNGFVNPGGLVHFTYRLNGDTDWKYLQPVDGAQTQADIFTGELSQGYDVKVWLENSEGIIGDAYELDNLSIGSIGGVGFTNDWDLVSDSVGFTNDWGLVSDAVGFTNDWGGMA